MMRVPIKYNYISEYIFCLIDHPEKAEKFHVLHISLYRWLCSYIDLLWLLISSKHNCTHWTAYNDSELMIKKTFAEYYVRFHHKLTIKQWHLKLEFNLLQHCNFLNQFDGVFESGGESVDGDELTFINDVYRVFGDSIKLITSKMSRIINCFFFHVINGEYEHQNSILDSIRLDDCNTLFLR